LWVCAGCSGRELIVAPGAVEVPVEWRGQPLYLSVTRSQARVHVFVDEREAQPLDALLADAEAQAWSIAPRDRFLLRADVPALALANEPPISFRRARFFTLFCPLIALIIFGVLGLIGLFTSLFERRRPMYLLFALVTTALAPSQLAGAGIGRELLALQLGGALAASVLWIYFIHAAFRNAPVALPLKLLVPVQLATFVVTRDRHLWNLVTLVLLMVAVVANVMELYAIVRRPRIPDQRVSVLFLLVGWIVLFVALPLQVASFGLLVLALSSILVLGREQPLRMRRGEFLTDELRHQLVERSRQLEAALARAAGRAGEGAAPGKVLADRYRLVRAIGEGAMGRVFECVRIADERPFALKLLTGRPGPAALARFAREAQLAAALHHPNLVSVHDVAMTDDGLLFLVMDFVPGVSLEREREHFGDWSWARPILVQIARGLFAMHSGAMVHRDLKPANILHHEGAVKIADFGIASLAPSGHDDTIESGSAADLTRTGSILGTPIYMAPELAQGGRGARPSVDLFAFGVIAWELSTGKLPFESAPVLARLEGRAVVPPPPLVSEAPPEVARMIDRCLSLDPNLRPSAAEMLAVLERQS
jgi:hypothetical protein